MVKNPKSARGRKKTTRAETARSIPDSNKTAANNDSVNLSNGLHAVTQEVYSADDDAPNQMNPMAKSNQQKGVGNAKKV